MSFTKSPSTQDFTLLCIFLHYLTAKHSNAQHGEIIYYFTFAFFPFLVALQAYRPPISFYKAGTTGKPKRTSYALFYLCIYFCIYLLFPLLTPVMRAAIPSGCELHNNRVFCLKWKERNGKGNNSPYFKAHHFHHLYFVKTNIWNWK